mmetsp:Transcript_63304/g.185051  ORF Transcript_63304/g.185051 Transcript_63304/m.185051 type:complete len:234 (+) Transcript_63304:447-1148(+)
MWLDPDDQFILRLVPEETVRRSLLELQPDDGVLGLQSLASLHDEGHTGPALVVEVEHDHCKGCASRRVAILLVELADVGIILVAIILANHTIPCNDGPNLLEDLDLLVPHVLRLQAGRRFHGNQGQDLHQVVLHDVSDDAIAIKVTSTTLYANGLLERDANIGNVVLMKKMAQLPIRKSKRQQVQHQSLGEVVVDAKSLALRKMLGQAIRKLPRLLAILPKRLFHNHTARTCL